jgi:hypothetical protein
VLLPDDESVHEKAIDDLRDYAEEWEWEISGEDRVEPAHDATIPEYTYSDGEWDG